MLTITGFRAGKMALRNKLGREGNRSSVKQNDSRLEQGLGEGEGGLDRCKPSACAGRSISASLHH